MMYNRFFLLLGTCGVLLFPSCSDNNAEGEGQTDDTLQLKVNTNAVKAENVFYYIPSPIETANLLKKAGADYDKELLNPIENVAKYTSTSARALNLGVYGADLSFTGIFDQSTESMLYMKCANNLASELRIAGAFGQNMRDRLEANSTNRDSILNIITDAYWDCDAILKENGQENTSALMIAGGWVEGFYLAAVIADKTKNGDVRVRVAEQKLSLETLVALLESKKDDKEVAAVLNDLRELKVLLDRLPKNTTETVVKDDEKGKSTEIGAAPGTPTISDEQFKEIVARITAIRTAIVNRS